MRRALRVLGGATMLIALAGVGGHLYAERDRGPAAPSTWQAASGERSDLTAGLSHVRLAGEGYALGRRHGELLGADVRDLVRYMREELIGGLLERDVALAQAWRLDARIPAVYREEMRGVADGAGVAYADVLLLNAYDDLVYLVGCSTAVIAPAAGRPLLHGHNVDYPLPYLAKHKVIFDIGTAGVQLRTIAFPGYIGVLTGMSSRGLALSSHTSVVAENTVGTPSGLVYRMMLERGGSIAEMHAILANAPRTIGNNLALSDAVGGDALAVELDAARLADRPAQRGRLFVTNHFQLPQMQAEQARETWGAGSESVARSDALARVLDPDAVADEAAVERALSETVADRSSRGVANDGTILSVVMLPATGQMMVARGTEPPVTTGGWIELAPAWESAVVSKR